MRTPIAALIACSIVTLSACSPEQTSSPPADNTQAAPAGAPGPRGTMVMNNVIVIADSGSTNMIGFRIMISANGEASYVSGDGPGNATLPPDLYARFKADIDAASPLSKLPTVSDCMKPVSMGSTTTITLGGEHSPDITCGDDPRVKKLSDDVDDIVGVLKIRPVPRSQGKELPPQNF